MQILESAPYNESSDIYSFGVFLWEFFPRLSPWTGHAAKSIIEMTIAGRRCALCCAVLSCAAVLCFAELYALLCCARVCA